MSYNLNITSDDAENYQNNYELIEKLGMVGAGHKLIELEKRIKKLEQQVETDKDADVIDELAKRSEEE